MGFKFLIFFCCTCGILILGIQTTSTSALAFPHYSDDSSEDSDGDLQQTGQLDDDFPEFQKNLGPPDRIQVQQSNTTDLDLNDPCVQRQATGPCQAYFPRYFLNQDTGKCQRFVYGGCGGSENNFKSLKECETRCSRHLRLAQPVSVSTSSASAAIICELPSVTPSNYSCLALIPRWTFDANVEKCVRFMYGGCGATRNNFENKYACQRACGDYRRSTTSGQGHGVGLRSVPGRKVVVPTCEQPMEAGPCYGMAKRYFFSREKNRCEKFTFGGCGGNDNNFPTGEECLRACGGDTPSDDEACSLIECPWNLYSHYQVLGCKPIYDGQACCPTRYDCPDANNTITWTAPTCTYKGQSYDVGEFVLEASTASSCRTSCVCYGFGGKPRINCASIECPENLGALPADKQNCTRLYKKDACCAHDFYCPNDTLSEGNGQYSQRPLPPVTDKCMYAGNEYVIGERFHPKDGRCLTCTCLKGFNGSLTDEFCRKIDCGIEIYYSSQLERGCVPVHFKDADGQDSCCPIGWQCPDERIPPAGPIRPRPPTPPNQPRSLPPSAFGARAYTPPADTSQGNHIQINQLQRTSVAVILNSSVCALPSYTGPCRGIRPRFFYNNATRTCESFTYGGCLGNGNNFVLRSDCERVCQNNTEVTDVNQAEQGQKGFARSGSIGSGFIQPKSFYITEVDPCVLPVKTGHCRGYFPRFYFSPEGNNCKYFVFGGCGGNQNNFMSTESCQATCQNKIPAESLRLSNSSRSGINSNAIVFNDNDSSDESGVVQRTRPSPALTHHVVDITPDQENEDSESEEFDASVVCKLKPVTGPCRAQKPRYYYDPEVQYCKRFTYGGCGGNANNFEKLKECDSRCAPSKGVGLPGQVYSAKWRTSSFSPDRKTDICKLPQKIGPCYGRFPSVTYDPITRSCQNFTYGGCLGNPNRFSTIEECNNVCRLPLEATAGDENGPGSHRVGHGIRGHNGGISLSDLPNQNDGLRSGVNQQGGRTENIADICSLGPAPGTCKGSHLRYFWHKDTSRCLPFMYSGCRGNSNNFRTESECISKCSAEPTIEQVTLQGVLTCAFGNESYALGASLTPDQPQTQTSEDEEPLCGVPFCQCITPPSLTCFQTACPLPPLVQELSTCPTPNCGPGCRPAVRLDNECPTCDCERGRPEWDVQVETIEPSYKKETKS